jgi:hypothetical protein
MLCTPLLFTCIVYCPPLSSLPLPTNGHTQFHTAHLIVHHPTHPPLTPTPRMPPLPLQRLQIPNLYFRHIFHLFDSHWFRFVVISSEAKRAVDCETHTDDKAGCDHDEEHDDGGGHLEAVVAFEEVGHCGWHCEGDMYGWSWPRIDDTIQYSMSRSYVIVEGARCCCDVLVGCRSKVTILAWVRTSYRSPFLTMLLA